MVSGSLFFRLSTNAGTAEILISDIWFLSSGSGAAVRASLLPRYQEPGIRHQASEPMPIRLRLSPSAWVWQGPILIPDP
jgi:hypothetical protein